jgi:hypothetical protein
MHQHQCSTSDQHIRLASALIANQGIYGYVTQLSRKYHLSRQWLSSLRAKGQEAMKEKFGIRAQRSPQEVQRDRIVLTVLTECHASREGIQKALEVILGEHISTGKISAIIHEAGKRAQADLKRQIPKGKRAIAIDEQYSSQRGEAYLNIVDVWSALVLASIPPVAVDTESWMLLLWQMQEQGLQWKVAVSDGGKAIADAVKKVTPDQVHQRDVWHVLHECQKVQGRIERTVGQMQEQTPKVERNAKRVQAGQKPLGRHPKIDVTAHALDLQQMEYAATSLRYLTCELQRLLEIVVLEDQGILSSSERQDDLDALLELFAELCKITPNALKKEVEKLFRHVELALPALVGFCPALDAIQQKAIEQLGEAAVHLIGWAWQRRAILGPKTERLVSDFAPAWQPMVTKLFEVWDEAVRSSSAVENWHSILRPHLAVHRHLSADLLAILAVWHNHRVAPRGLHQGQSPMMRSGLAKEPTDWLVALGYPPASAPPGRTLHSLPSPKPDTESIPA